MSSPNLWLLRSVLVGVVGNDKRVVSSLAICAHTTTRSIDLLRQIDLHYLHLAGLPAAPIVVQRTDRKVSAVFCGILSKSILKSGMA